MAAPAYPTLARRTRMLKASCDQCGYVTRTTRKHLETSGPPICPCNHEPMRSDEWQEVLEARGEVLAMLDDSPRQLASKWVNATRKLSTCGSCGGEIPAGDSCRVTPIQIDGRLDSLRECASCADPRAGRGYTATAPGTRGEWRTEY